MGRIIFGEIMHKYLVRVIPHSSLFSVTLVLGDANEYCWETKDLFFSFTHIHSSCLLAWVVEWGLGELVS